MVLPDEIQRRLAASDALLEKYDVYQASKEADWQELQAEVTECMPHRLLMFHAYSAVRCMI